ncbi:MAG: gliding motility-associated C-terminal domain-containing protein [Cytophagaceae bacterium]|nr:gliding motility-associated C-terminal domain-containing protein [Cytophagaceae bacterium]
MTSNKSTVCGTEKATLTATGCNGTVTWSVGGTGTTKEVSAGTYTATCTNACGTSVASAAITIGTGVTPTAPTITGSTGPVCGTEKVTLSASACTSGTIRWSTSETTSTISVGAGTYTATCVNDCGSSPASNTITVTQGATPTAPTLTSNKSTVCGTEKATLTATGCNGTVTWSVGGTGTTKEVSAGTYTATCTNACGTSVASAAITIGTGVTPTAPTITGSTGPVCGTEKVTLTASSCSSGTIRWSTSETTSTISVGAGTYTATCVNDCGSSPASNAITVTQGATPTAPTLTSNKSTVCGTEKATLTATGCNGTVTWSVGGTGTTKEVSAGTYTVTCTNACGTSVASAAITIGTGVTPTAPTITGSTGPVCGTEKVTLSASACTSGTIRWSTSETTSTISVGAGTYTATCVNDCGSSPASNTITVTQGATPTAPTLTSNKSTVCGTEKATLTATGCNGTVTWSVGGTGTTKEVSAGTYTATCTNACGTSVASAAITIGTGVTPTAPTITGSTGPVCGTEKVTLTASACTSGTIRWSTSETTSTISVGAGTYTATCVNDCGSSPSSNAITVTQGITPSAPVIAASKNEICGTESITLTATNCTGQIKWSNNATGTSTTISNPGDYAAVCITACGESPNSNIVTIVRGAIPNPPLVTTDKVSVCGTEKARLVAIGCSSTVIWNTGEQGESILVGTGTYTAVCSNSCGSSVASNVVKIDVNGRPSAPSITADRTSICGSDSAKLTSEGCSGTVTWSNGKIGNSIFVKQIGTYTAKCTNDCGTSIDSDPITITSGGSAPVAPVIAANKTSICVGDSAILTVTGCSGTVTWNTSGVGNRIVVYSPGTYSAVCSNGCGTSPNSNAIVIERKTTGCSGTGCNITAPVISASKLTICEPEDITLTAAGCATGTVIWSNGKTGASIVVKPVANTTYNAVCKLDTCISAVSQSLTIKVNKTTKPIIACATDLVCPGETTTLTAYECEGEVKWSNGMIGHQIEVAPTTLSKYTAVCVVGTCTSEASDTVCVNVGVPAKPFIACKSNTICFGESAIITATGCNGVVVWSTGQSGSVLTVTPTTSGVFHYTAKCRAKSGECQSDDSNIISISVGGVVAAPKALSEVKNVCPFETVDLNSAILGDPSTSGGSYEFHISNSPNSTLITTTGSVQAGNYYLFERSKFGCFSTPTMITVKIDNCGPGGIKPDSTKFVDISLYKTASAKIVPVGQIVEYNVVIKNLKAVKATNLVVRDIIPQGLEIDTVSTNATYANGMVKINIDSLKINDSVKITYRAKVTAAGKIVNNAELFAVDQIDNVLSNNTSSYTINDYSTTNLVGLSKNVGTIRYISDKIYEVPFTFNIQNMGAGNLSKIQLVDDLAATFGSGALIVDDKIQVTTENGLVANPNFTGRGGNTNLLIDSLSSLGTGQSLAVDIKVKVNMANATKRDFFNTATVYANNRTISDVSTAGTNPDPDNDGNPNNNDEPTKFTIGVDSSTVGIAVALSISDTSEVDDQTYEVKYMALVKNIGFKDLKNVSIVDSLTKTFPDSVQFSIVGSTTFGGSKMKINPSFNGKTDYRLVLGDSTSKLAVGKTDTLHFTVHVKYSNNYGPYFSNLVAYGKTTTGQDVSDISNSGIVIKPELSDPTILRIPKDGIISEILVDRVELMDGFSPNDDGKNETLNLSVKEGSGEFTIESFEIYNRWGHLIWKSTNQKVSTENGIQWDATSNTGLRFGPEGVPDGTYYYAIKATGQPNLKVGFITVAR